jgi:hypothetical protein
MSNQVANRKNLNSPFYLLKDAKGEKSLTSTLVLVSFAVTTLAYVFSIFEKLGTLEPRPFDVAACSTYLIPILTLYFGRRWTDSKSPKPADENKEQE